MPPKREIRDGLWLIFGGIRFFRYATLCHFATKLSPRLATPRLTNLKSVRATENGGISHLVPPFLLDNSTPTCQEKRALFSAHESLRLSPYHRSCPHPICYDFMGCTCILCSCTKSRFLFVTKAQTFRKGSRDPCASRCLRFRCKNT